MSTRALPQDWEINARLRTRIARRIKADAATGCWNWTGGKNNGYGIVRVGARVCKAHRVVWALLRGPLPVDRDLDHVCRNRACVNPDHLEPVTPQINVYRGIGPSGVNRRKTHCKRGHELSGDNVRIYATKAEGGTRRICRACRIVYERARYAATRRNAA